MSVGLLVLGATVTLVSAAGCFGAGRELRVLLLLVSLVLLTFSSEANS